MSTVELLANQDYKYGFVTDIESDVIPRGLTEDTVRLISEKKSEPDFMLEFRLKAYRHWLTMQEPRHWPNLIFPEIDYQDVIYYSAPRQKAVKASLDEAQKLGLQGTPSFFINGRFFSGNVAYEQLRQIVDEELKRSSNGTVDRASR